MPFDPVVTRHEFLGAEDRRWLGHRMGADANRPITLDASAFLPAHVSVKGGLPSGTVLGQITATGLYGPYTPQVGEQNEKQTLTEGGAGLTSFTITGTGPGAGTTAAIDDDATAAEVQAELETLYGGGNVAVTGGPLGTGPFTVEFLGDLANQNLPAMTTTPTGGTGTVVVATAQAGSDGAAPVVPGLEVAAFHLFNTTKLGDGSGLDLATAHDVGTAGFWGPGIVKVSFLPVFAGTNIGELDAQARRDLSQIRYEA